jgi:signal transduction histidine kinase
VLVNLFRNAVEHGSTGPDSQARQDAVEQGGDDVAVRVGDLGDGGFFVADDGLGIPPDERDAVLDSGYTNSEAGTGYGLAIVDEIAAAHDWSLSVTESREGGARFEFRT